MREDFLNKFQLCGNDRNKLSALMAEVDAEKRSLKSNLNRLSSEPDGELSHGRKRQVSIRKMRDKESFLTSEREFIRNKLGSMKMDKKSLNKCINNRSVDFVHAFMAAAERLLSEETFLEIESRASEILSANSQLNK
ncbi:MAG: hypothetical protein QM500_15595 [Methylococcales bacterium]